MGTGARLLNALSLRARLALLVAGTALPLIVFVAVVAIWYYMYGGGETTTTAPTPSAQQQQTPAKTTK